MSRHTAVLGEPFGHRRAYVLAGHQVCLLAHQNERLTRQAVQQLESRAFGAGDLLRALRQVRPAHLVAYEVHRPQPGSKERRTSPLLDFVGPLPRAAMGALEASATIRGPLDLELMTLCVAVILRIKTVSSWTPRSVPLRVTLEQFADVRPGVERYRDCHVRLVLLQR